jgi:MFS family permease
VAVTAVFLAHGLLFASWTAHIPLVKARLGLSDGTLGLALLGAPVGSVSATVAAGFLLPRLGSRRVIRICLVGYCLLGIALGQARSLPALFCALLGWGLFQGLLDVSMNTQAITVERRQGRPLMSGLHGCWSIGSFVGAGAGTLGVALGLSLSTQMAVLGLPTLGVTWLLATRMLSDSAPLPAVALAGADGPGADGPAPLAPAARRLSRVVLLLGVIAFASMLCEGATADWGSVYLHGSLHTSTTVAGLGYATFSFAMVTVRLSGNRLLSRFSPRRILPVLAAVATVGFAAGLAGHDTASSLIGFATLGLGLGSIVPAVFSAAGRIPGAHAGTSVATVAAFGWAGFLCGPPLIGQLAAALSLPVALGLIPLLTAFIVMSTSRTGALDGGPAALRPDRSRPAAG